MDYLELAIHTLENTLSRGATACEVYIISQKANQIITYKKEIESINQSRTKGLVIRALVNNKTGIAYTSSFDHQSIDKTVDRVLSLANESSINEHRILPKAPDKIPHMNVYDKKIDTLSLNDKIRIAQDIEDAAFSYDPRIRSSQFVTYSDTINQITIVNSNGLKYSWDETGFSLYCLILAEQNGKQQEVTGMRASRFIDKVNPRELGESIASRAVLAVGGTPVKTGQYPVILDKEVSRIFLIGIANALLGDAVIQHRSFLANKLGKQIGSELLTVLDDGTINEAIGSRPIDAEGVLTSKKILIDKGILKSFLYDTYSAHKIGTESTGNAVRHSYESAPQVGITTFFVRPGKKCTDEMIKDIDEGLYVVRTIGSGGNPVTGDFSVGAAGVWLKNGELREPVTGVIISGNLLQMMNDIIAVSNELMWYGNLGCPAITIKKMVIAGK